MHQQTQARKKKTNMNPSYPQYPQQDPEPQEPSQQPGNGTIGQPFSLEQPATPSQFQQQQYGPQQSPYQADPYLTAANQQPINPQGTPPNIFVAEPTIPSKKPFLLIFIILGALLLIALAGGAYYGWKEGWFGGAQTTEQAAPEAPQVVESTYDTPDNVQTEIDAVQEALDGIDDSQLADDTISDETLNQ